MAQQKQVFDINSLLVGATTSINITNDALAEALQKREEERKGRISTVLLGVLDEIEAATRNGVTRLREIRKSEQKEKNHLSEITRAAQYFGETNNPFPFLYRNYLYPRLTHNAEHSEEVAIKRFRDSHSFMRMCDYLGVSRDDIPNEALYVPSSWKPTKSLDLTK